MYFTHINFVYIYLLGLHPPGPPLARPILPRERGALDRIVEYLVGDGPQNRYALICQQCFSHNGMALKEEFEYIAFRCAYCFFLNPARKTRPQAPRLPEFSFEKRQALEVSNTVGSLPSESVISSENQINEGGAIPQMSHFLSETSGMKSNWLKLNPNKVTLIGEDIEAGYDSSTMLETEATIPFG